MKNNILTILFVTASFIFLILGCGGTSQNSSVSQNPTPKTAETGKTANTETKSDAPKATSIQAKALTKEYDSNELSADEKYRGKLLAVAGKVSNIAETFGNITVQLEGHDIVKSVMCSFAESEKSNVAKLKKGQNVTLVGTGDGMTAGLYAGLKDCKVQ